MSEVQLDPYVLHQFSAEPVYLEGSRVDSVFVQDAGLEFTVDRYLVDRQSLQTYEATIELTGLHPNAPILCDAVYPADLFEYQPHTAQRVYTEFYLDDRLTDAGIPPFPSETPTSGEVPIPPYPNAYDGSTQVRVRYSQHPALQPEDPDEQYLNSEFPFTNGPYFILDSVAHPNHPYYFYIYPPLPATFTVRVVAVLVLPREYRSTPPTDVGPFEALPDGNLQYPVGGHSGPGIEAGEYGPPSTEADTTYAHVERVDWPTHRLDVLQFGNLIPPGEVFVGPGPRGVVHSRQVPGRRTVAESIAAQVSDIIVTDVGGASNAVRLGEPGVVGAGGRGRGVVLRPQTKTPV